MSASFPNAKKTFSQIVNGVTKLVASIFNVNYDETEAIETFIGPTGGGAQSYSESLTNMLINYRKECRCDYKSAADLYVRSGEIMITDASGNRRLRRNTSDTTVTWTDIDTGSEASSTTYYIYAVADSNATTFTVKISANATTPSGCTFYRKTGSFYNDGSSNITTVIDKPGSIAPVMNVVTFTGNAGAQAVAHGLGVKPKAAIFLSSNQATNCGFWIDGMTSGYMHSLGAYVNLVGTVDETNFNFIAGDGQNNASTIPYVVLFFG